MPARFETYGPELTALMKGAFQAALPKLARDLPVWAEVREQSLASAIIDAVNTGLIDSNEIANRAVSTLRASDAPLTIRATWNPPPHRNGTN